MTGPLCDAVTGREGSGSLLRELAHSNLFVVSLDEQGEWYRYHHLFSELLLYELKSSRPELVPDLRGRASVWLEGAGYFEGASGRPSWPADYERAGLLIARHWYGYVVAGQTATVQRWLGVVAREMLAHGAALALVKAWICALGGRREESESFLVLAESIPHEGPLPDGTASVESGVAIVGPSSAMVASRHGSRRPGAPWSWSRAEARRGPRWCASGWGPACISPGDTREARKPLEEALGFTEDGQPLLRMVTLSFLSFVATDEGRLEEAESLAREAQALVDRFETARDSPDQSGAYRARACARRTRETREAQKELESGLSARRRLPGMSPWPTLIGLLALAPVLAARGDRAGGRAVLTEARAILELIPMPACSPSFSSARNGSFAPQAAGGAARRGAHGARAGCAAPPRRRARPPGRWQRASTSPRAP